VARGCCWLSGRLGRVNVALINGSRIVVVLLPPAALRVSTAGCDPSPACDGVASGSAGWTAAALVPLASVVTMAYLAVVGA